MGGEVKLLVECRRSPLSQFELRRPRLNKRKLKARGRLIRCFIISNVGSDNFTVRRETADKF